jgi:hypothetical protein
MILMTREYHAFCERAFGGYLHHSPDSTLTTPMPDLLSRTLAISDRHELGLGMFSADSDAGIPDGYVWEPADFRRTVTCPARTGGPAGSSTALAAARTGAAAAAGVAAAAAAGKGVGAPSRGVRRICSPCLN